MATIRSTAKFVRISPTKASLVAALVRGRSANEALQLLKFTQKAAATPIYKALHSAVANAENNHKLKREDLQIVRLETTAGPTLKRFRPRARGSAARILKRTTHIHVELQERSVVAETAQKPKRANQTQKSSPQATKQPKTPTVTKGAK